MTNGDYNFPFQPEHYANDRRLSHLTIAGAFLVAILAVVLIILVIK